MKNMFCSNEVPKFKGFEDFVGCDGKPWDNDFLQFHIDKAVSEENYEWAQKCKNEMDRRKALTEK